MVRFLSEDPWPFGGLSVYAYVGNMPVWHVDPSGAVNDYRGFSSHDEDWATVIAHCGGRYVNGCANVHGTTTCVCSPACDLATHKLVYKANVTIDVSIDVHNATNSPYQTLADIRKHEMAHVAFYNRLLDETRSVAQDLERKRFSTMLECKADCATFLLGRSLSKIIRGTTENVIDFFTSW